MVLSFSFCSLISIAALSLASIEHHCLSLLEYNALNMPKGERNLFKDLLHLVLEKRGKIG
jgi:hypothetical protein